MKDNKIDIINKTQKKLFDLTTEFRDDFKDYVKSIQNILDEDSNHMCFDGKGIEIKAIFELLVLEDKNNDKKIVEILFNKKKELLDFRTKMNKQLDIIEGYILSKEK